MEFVTVSTRLWKDRWVRSLTPPHKLLFIYLATSETSDYGFYEYDPESWAVDTGLEIGWIENAIAKFIDDNKVSRDGDLVLVIKALTHRRLSPANYTSALNAIRRRYGTRSPAMVALCETRNSQGLTTTHSETRGDAVSGYLSGTPSGTDQIKDNTPADAGELTKIAARNKELHPLAVKLSYIVGQGERQLAVKHPAKFFLDKAANTLRLIVDTDKISEDELLAVARWCFITGTNTEFYLANMAAIHLWRKYWKNAGCSAILDACRKYAAAHVDTAKPYYTPPRQERDFTGGDGEPGPGSIDWELTDEDRCELEKQRQMAAIKECEHATEM